jgi:hypothetical protein
MFNIIFDFKIVLILLIVFSISISCVNQERQKTKDNKFKLNTEDVAVVIPELHSISELKAILEIADIGFNPEIINQTEYVSLYFGDQKIAANIGVYLADLVYVMSTKENPDIYKEYGAIFELAKQFGFADDLLNVTLERYENGNTSVDQLFELLEKSLENSSKNMSGSEVSEFSSYLLLGNYIEKLYIVSSLLQQRNDKVDVETEAEMKSGLLSLMTRQSIRIDQMIYVLSKYPNRSLDVLVLEDLQLLFNNYLNVEANRDKILKLKPVELYNSKEVITIFNQIEKIRNRIVLL